MEARAITIAILAMGGEGGGVLADWIVDLAEQAGYLAQLTSVPGVAQRTGATIYYLEIFPEIRRGAGTRAGAHARAGRGRYRHRFGIDGGGKSCGARPWSRRSGPP